MPSPTPKQRLINLINLLVIVGLSTFTVIWITQSVGGPRFSVNQVTTQKQSTFDVTGESHTSTIPDQAEVRMGITVNAGTVQDAQNQANTIINDVNTQLNHLGIAREDIKTDNYSLNPNYDYQSGDGQQIVGYTVTTNIVVTLTDFAKLNQAIDAATQVGANQIGGISFTLSDEKRAEVERQARKEAIDNAQEKAQEIAQLAGMQLGAIVNVMEWTEPQYDVYPATLALERSAVGSAAPTNVEPGSTTFSYSVTLSYETL